MRKPWTIFATRFIELTGVLKYCSRMATNGCWNFSNWKTSDWRSLGGRSPIGSINVNRPASGVFQPGVFGLFVGTSEHVETCWNLHITRFSVYRLWSIGGSLKRALLDVLAGLIRISLIKTSKSSFDKQTVQHIRKLQFVMLWTFHM